MNKGLDALDTMLCNMHPEEIGNFRESINTIKQELERLEELEKENKLLDETIEADDNIIQKLIKANQILKDKGKELLKDFRKAIDIIKQFEKFIEWLKNDDDGNLFLKDEVLDKLKELKLYKEK